ncbi:Diverged AAA-family ATPase containing protein [Microbacterium esteraromaticum]|uniref:Diverged AAA-family ATPase containing protein n=2 Tax=Microbacterium esteraromaticum TaxID=57043 RepID=A0A1R4I7H8_9MICO|nr:Diverged AAA-family ATPase containing protein [Microbacterium esteraromaticum]
MTALEGLKELLRERIATQYLDSPDFNGVAAAPLMDVAAKLSVDSEVALAELVADGAVYANFGHEMVNPHILGFPHQSAADNLAEVQRRGGVRSAVLYPTKGTLAAMSAGERYPSAPYSAALALGHAQLESIFFRADVLGRYRDDPRYDYTLDIGGEIRAREGTPLDTYLTTFSIGFDGDTTSDEIVVGVPLRYLHDLSPTEQSYWKSFEHERQDWVLHPDWVRPHLMGEFPERVSPYTAILMEMSLVNEICDVIGYPTLFRTLYEDPNRPTDYGYLIRPTKRELSTFIEQLNKLLIDNLDQKFFRQAKIPLTEERQDGDGNIYQGQRGTMNMLIEWMDRTVTHDPEGMVQSAAAILKEIRRARSKTAHKLHENEYDSSMWTDQRHLVVEAYLAVRTVRQLLQSHPKASAVKVSEELDEAKVWPF